VSPIHLWSASDKTRKLTVTFKWHDDLVLVGPTGEGKSWLAPALGQNACQHNQSVLYQLVPRLFQELTRGSRDGRHPRLLRSLGQADLLFLANWRLEPLDAGVRDDLLEILEKRYERRSTMITSLLPVDRGHDIIGDPTYAIAILDLFIHKTNGTEITGESLRRGRGKHASKA